LISWGQIKTQTQKLNKSDFSTQIQMQKLQKKCRKGNKINKSEF
jgi:hypothetical protein